MENLSTSASIPAPPAVSGLSPEEITGAAIFIDYIAQIQNVGIQELVALVMDRIGVGNKYFFNAPASSSRKHHPTCSNVTPGGLVRHVFRAIEIGKHICRALDFSDIERDIVIASLIMHDIWKNDFKHHASRAGREIMETIGANPHLFKTVSVDVLAQIVKCVQLHMGPWTENGVKKKPMQEYALTELAVYLSDYISSRQDIATTQDACSLDLVKAFFSAQRLQ